MSKFKRKIKVENLTKCQEKIFGRLEIKLGGKEGQRTSKGV